MENLKFGDVVRVKGQINSPVLTIIGEDKDLTEIKTCIEFGYNGHTAIHKIHKNALEIFDMASFGYVLAFLDGIPKASDVSREDFGKSLSIEAMLRLVTILAEKLGIPKDVYILTKK